MVKGKEIKVISSKWFNFEPKQKPIGFIKPSITAPRYKVIFKGFTGTEKDMETICKEMGEKRSIHYERTLGIKNGTVFVEFNSLKDPMVMKLDLLVIQGLPMMFLKWYENGIRQIGFMQSQYEENKKMVEENEENEYALENLTEDTEMSEIKISETVSKIEARHTAIKEKEKEKEEEEKKQKEDKQKSDEKNKTEDEENNIIEIQSIETPNAEEISVTENEKENDQNKGKKRKNREATTPSPISNKKPLNKTPNEEETFENKVEEELTPIISKKQGRLKQTKITEQNYERNQHNDA